MKSNPNVGEPLHVQAGMICCDNGVYLPVSKIVEVTKLENRPVCVSFEHLDEFILFGCTLAEFLDAMEEARKQLGGVHVSSVHGNATFTVNEPAACDYPSWKIE